MLYEILNFRLGWVRLIKFLKIAVGQTQLIDLNRLGQSGFSPFGSPSVVSYIKIILQKS